MVKTQVWLRMPFGLALYAPPRDGPRSGGRRVRRLFWPAYYDAALVDNAGVDHWFRIDPTATQDSK